MKSLRATRLLQYGTPGGATIFDFRMAAGAKARRVFWTSSRGFYKPTDMSRMSVIGIVELMDELFAIGARARDEKMEHAARHAQRQRQTPPLLDKIHAQILALSKNVLPESAAGEACAYTVKLWKN